MIFDTINERYAEAQQESDEDKGDLFKAGRALAYWEVSEIIKIAWKCWRIERGKKAMEEVRSWECPFYHRVVGEDECYDLFLIATRAVRDEKLVKEKDRDALSLMCDECRNYLK